MVEVDGTGRPSRSRCQPMVAGPASRPRHKVDPQCGDPIAERVGRAAGTGARPARPRIEAIDTGVAVPAKEPVQVAAAYAGLGRRGGDGELR